MALFGEKYGDWVRVIEVDEVSRELCGGTHVRNTGEVGIFKIVGEGSSAANVRRIEALTGPAAIDWFQARSAALDEAGALLGSPRDAVAGARRASERLRELERQASEAGRRDAGEAAEALVGSADDVDGIKVLVSRADGVEGKALLDLADRVKAKLGEGAVVLGSVQGEKVMLVASFSKGVVERGLRAGETIREVAGVVGGGGGGRDDVAQAGGRDPEKLDEALTTARRTIERELGS
jgi:alanyl-tRNA synthetase